MGGARSCTMCPCTAGPPKSSAWLMAQPRVSLVDESTEGLAPVIVQALERTLLALAASGTSVVVVESKLAVASRIAARNYVMTKGKTVFHDTSGDLRDNYEIRREYLEV
jgi:branched-chain amino acid transport system ATP-binding protein